MPTYVLAELFGLPEADRERFGPWVQTLTRLQNEGFDANAWSGDTQRRPRRAKRACGSSARCSSTSRLPSPRLDAIPATTCWVAWSPPRSTANGSATGTSSGFCFVVVAGGADTTAEPDLTHRSPHGSADGSARAAAGRPGADPGRTRGVPALRVLRAGAWRAPPIEDVEVDGVEIPAGEKVLMLYGSANRDPREYGETADRLDVRVRSAATWRSAVVRTSASAATSRGCRRGSRSRSCSPPSAHHCRP